LFCLDALLALQHRAGGRGEAQHVAGYPDWGLSVDVSDLSLLLSCRSIDFTITIAEPTKKITTICIHPLWPHTISPLWIPSLYTAWQESIGTAIARRKTKIS
jgi:hypothetical protein